MNRKLLIGLLCLLVLCLILTAVLLENRSDTPDTPEGTTSATGETEVCIETTAPSAIQVLPPDDLPSVMDLPVGSTDSGMVLPYHIPGYDLVIEKMAPYSGMFVEDGTNAQVENVAMLLVRNEGEYPVEYAQISVEYAQQTLTFDISALPAGQALVVQESSGKVIPDGKVNYATAMVIRRADMGMSEDKVRVTDNGNNSLTVENLTEQNIPTVRVFYKYYMEEEEIFVGGIAFTVRLTNLAGGESVTVQPSHYTSQSSRVVMVLTYDTEV